MLLAASPAGLLSISPSSLKKHQIKVLGSDGKMLSAVTIQKFPTGGIKQGCKKADI